jgi:glutathione S-transferase
MFEIQILLPLRDNAGVTFTPAEHQAFLGYLAEKFGGATLMPGTATGVWTENGVTYTDETLVAVVAVDGFLKQAAAIAEAAEEAKRRYRQLAVYVRYLGLSEVV